MLDVVDPGVEWHDVFGEMLGGEAAVYRGHEGVRELFRDHIEAFAALHTEYSEIRDLGENPKAVQEFMGHATITMTFDQYGHLFPGSRDEARARVDAFLLAQLTPALA